MMYIENNFKKDSVDVLYEKTARRVEVVAEVFSRVELFPPMWIDRTGQSASVADICILHMKL